MHYVPTEYHIEANDASFNHRNHWTRWRISCQRLYDIGYTVAIILRRTSVPGQLKKLEWVFGGKSLKALNFSIQILDAPSDTGVHDFVLDGVYNLAAQSHVGISFQSHPLQLQMHLDR